MRKKLLSLALLAVIILGCCAGTGHAETNAEREKVNISFLQYGVILDNVDYAKDPIKPIIEEKVNVTLSYETYPGEQWAALVEMNVAGGTIPDLFHNLGDAATTRKFVEDGMVWKISDIINAEPERYPILYGIINSPEYKMFNEYYTGDPESAYAFYSLQANPAYCWIAGDLTYNKMILEAAGFDHTPETVEEFMAYGKAAAEAGYVGWYPRNGTLTNFEYIDKAVSPTLNTTFNTDPGNAWNGMMQDEDGQWFYAVTSDASKQALTLLAQMYKDGTLPAALGTMPDFETTKDMWANDEIGAVSYAVTSPAAYNDIMLDYRKGDPDATIDEIVIGSLLKNADGEIGPQFGTSFWMGFNWYIPTTCDYPDRVLDLIEWIGTNEGQKLLFNGIEGELYTEAEDGAISFNVPAWDVITQMYIQTGGRCSYPPFQFLYSATQMQIGWEDSEKSWFEQSKEMRDYTSEINGGWPEWYTYAKPLTDANRAAAFRELPPYYAIIDLPEDLKEIRVKVHEVGLEYIPAFITGKKDIEAEWGDFVQKINDLGIGQVVESFNGLVSEAAAKFESYTQQ